MVESIVCVGWIWRNVDDVGESSTGSEGIGKRLKRRKGEGVETESICDFWKRCNDRGAKDT